VRQTVIAGRDRSGDAPIVFSLARVSLVRDLFRPELRGGSDAHGQ
jgi:hypothetical protein